MKRYLVLIVTVFILGCVSQSKIVSPYENETKTPTDISTEPKLPMPVATSLPSQLPALQEFLSIPANTSEGKTEFSELYELVKNGSYIYVENLRDIKTNAKLIFADGWSSGAKYDKYFIHGPLGSNGKWVKIVINDGDQNNLTVDTLVINVGETKLSKANLKLFVADVRALADGTVVGSDVWISNS